MENIMKLITIRSGYFALFVFFCLIIFIICICIIGRIQMIKRKNYKVYYPAKKYQINHLKTKYDENKRCCYISHSLIDKKNITLKQNIPLSIEIRNMINHLSKIYNVILIHKNIMDNDISYNLPHLITYLNEYNIPVCRICSEYNIKLAPIVYKKQTQYSSKIIGEYMIEVLYVSE